MKETSIINKGEDRAIISVTHETKKDDGLCRDA